jgi:hypothetical protein
VERHVADCVLLKFPTTHATLQLVPGAMPSQLWAMPGSEMAVVLQPHGLSGSGGYHALHRTIKT